jgi:hypothetical protein
MQFKIQVKVKQMHSLTSKKYVLRYTCCGRDNAIHATNLVVFHPGHIGRLCSLATLAERQQSHGQGCLDRSKVQNVQA